MQSYVRAKAPSRVFHISLSLAIACQFLPAVFITLFSQRAAGVPLPIISK